jgi:predicted nucleotidyltransferase
MNADDEIFLARTAARLAALPGVRAVSLGGSRAQGEAGADSDWDFAVYYEGAFDPEELRGAGWSGYVSKVGEWGGVFNGGAWLVIDGRRSDIHYRDLAVVEEEIARAQSGQFGIEPLMFHLAGIPTYLVVAELALGRVLTGDLPAPLYPEALRVAAPARWWDRATRTFDYAIGSHARAGRLIECVGLLGQAVAQSAHAVMAARGQWVTNDKRLITQAGLRGVDELITGLREQPDQLTPAGRAIRQLCQDAVERAHVDPAPSSP